MSSSAIASQGPSNRLRILQLCAVDFTARQFLQPLTAALECEGYSVVISCARGQWFDELQEKGFRMIDNPISRSANVFKHARSIWKTARLLRKEKISVLHVHTPVAALVGRVAARLAGTPLVIYTAHGFYFHENSKLLTKRALILLEKAGAFCGDFIMAVSDEDRQSALKYGIARERSIETIYNGVDTQHFSRARFSAQDRAAFRQNYGIPVDAKVVGILGRLVREKGFFEFFEAARAVLQKHPDAWFMAVGDLLPSDYDGRREELKNHIAAMGVSHRVVFTGMVDDPAPCLNAMDVFSLPSYREGMPISLLEAMAVSLPCVATDIRGCREEVVDGETGYLVPARDATALAEKINTLLDDPAKATKLGHAGRERVLQQFDIRKVVNHQLEIYKRLIQKKGL